MPKVRAGFNLGRGIQPGPRETKNSLLPRLWCLSKQQFLSLRRAGRLKEPKSSLKNVPVEKNFSARCSGMPSAFRFSSWNFGGAIQSTRGRRFCEAVQEMFAAQIEFVVNRSAGCAERIFKVI